MSYEHFIEKIFDGLPWEFKSKPVVSSLACAYGIQFDHLKQTIEQRDFLRDVLNADYPRLVQLANLVGEPGRPDDLEIFRALVMGRIIASVSDGSSQHVRRLYNFLFPTLPYELRIFEPRHFRILQNVQNVSDVQAHISKVRVYLPLFKATIGSVNSLDFLLYNDNTYRLPKVSSTASNPLTIFQVNQPIGVSI